MKADVFIGRERLRDQSDKRYTPWMRPWRAQSHLPGWGLAGRLRIWASNRHELLHQRYHLLLRRPTSKFIAIYLVPKLSETTPLQP